MSWSQLSGWWLDELSDPAYNEVVTPMLRRMLPEDPIGLYLDIGCGEGRMMRSLFGDEIKVFGLEPVQTLAQTAARAAPTVVGAIPHLPIRADSFNGAYAVLVLEHLWEVASFFRETARVVRTGGVLLLVINHPTWTAPGSTPITDTDGEVLWRPGEYFSNGTTEEPAGDGTVTFHHRSMAELLNAAAAAGWRLEEMEEQPHHEFEDQSGIPRLLSCRWRLIP